MTDHPLDFDAPMEMAVELDGSSGSLDGVLHKLVEAAGGQAGVMTTWLDKREPQTSVFGMDLESSSGLVQWMESSVQQLGGSVPPALLAELEREARASGSGRPLAIPVRSKGETVGLLCLWHLDEAPELLRESPGLYNLPLDGLEAGIQSARLLERLMQERKWLEAVVQHTSDGVVIVDKSGRVVGYNLAMARMSGWKLGEAVGELSHEAFPVVLEENQGGTALQLAFERQYLNSTAPAEAKLLGHTGESLEVEVLGAPLWDRRGQALGWVMTVRDISRRKEMERLQKIFLSAVSHELQTPIAIIRGFAGLLSDPELTSTPEQTREKARIIVEESERLEKMVQQMLYATRIQAGGVKLEREVVNMAELARRVAQKMAPMLANGKTRLELDLPDDLPPVFVDPEKLQQVLTNLIENALKYAAGKPIHVQACRYLRPGPQLPSGNATKARTWLRLEVSDSGPGIPKIERDRIFSPFERGGDPLKSRVRGAGLGLYICKAIIEAHGGQVGVDEAKGGGACFYFLLPAEQRD
jgi:PAS domain S-box-containing protein